MSEESEERLDEEAAIEILNEALVLQYRSALQYTLTSGSLFGFEFQSLGDRLWEFAHAEQADARLLVEKIVALGGSPTTEVGELRWSGEPGEAVDLLIESEGYAIEALAHALEPTGREGRSEATRTSCSSTCSCVSRYQVDFLASLAPANSSAHVRRCYRPASISLIERYATRVISSSKATRAASPRCSANSSSWR